MPDGLAPFWAVLRSPAVRIALSPLALLAALGLAEARGRAQGMSMERSRWEARWAADQAAAAKIAAAQAAAGAAVGARVEARQAEARAVTQTLIREVPRYVSVEADARCDVPAGLVRLHDAAASGMPPIAEPADGVADAPSGLALSAVAMTVAENYGVCHAAFEQVKGWQAWWAAVTAAVQREGGKP